MPNDESWNGSVYRGIGRAKEEFISKSSSVFVGKYESGFSSLRLFTRANFVCLIRVSACEAE